MNAATAQQPRQIVLGKDVLLIRFVRHYADGRYQIRVNAEVTVKGQAIAAAHASAPRSILIPKPIHDMLAEGFRPLDTLIEGTQRYPIAGLKGMTETALAEFVPRWEVAQAGLFAARERVRAAWDDEVEGWNRTHWVPILGADYEEEVGRRLRRIRHNLDLLYSVEYDVWEPPRPAGDLEVGSPVVRKWLEAGRANAEKAVEEALLEFVTAPLNTLVEAAGEIIEVLKDPNTKVIRPSTFNTLRQAMHKLRGLREVSDADLLAQIDTMEGQLDAVIENAESSLGSFTAAIKAQSSDLQDAIVTILDVAKAEASRAASLASYGRAGRAIELD